MNKMTKNKLYQAVVGVAALWATTHALAADPALKIDRFPPVTGGGEFVSDVTPEPIKPNVFIVLDNSGSMEWTGSGAMTTTVTNPALGLNNALVRGTCRNNCSRWNQLTGMQEVTTGLLNGIGVLEGKVRLGFSSINRYNTGADSLFDGLSRAGSTLPTPPDSADRTQYKLIPRDFSGAYAETFYRWLTHIAPNGGTPLRQATQSVINSVVNNTNNSSIVRSPNGKELDFFADAVSDKSSPDFGWPVKEANNIQSCRPNFLIMVADGGYNGRATTILGVSENIAPSDTPFNQMTRTLPSPLTVNGKSYTEYTPQSVYDFWMNRNQALSSFALYAWLTDLRPDLKNDVAPYWHNKDEAKNPIPRLEGPSGAAIDPVWDRKNDPATWQHLTFFSVGLVQGIQQWRSLSRAFNSLYGLTTSDKDGVEGYFRSLEDGSTDASGRWHLSNTRNVEQDFAQAAAMGRGEALSVSDPDSFQAALDRIVTRIEEAYNATRPLKSTISGTVSTTAITSTQETDAMLYSATVDVQEHTGDVLGYKLCSGADASCSGFSEKDPSWSAADKLYQQLASNGNTGYEDAKIYTLNSAGEVKDFNWSSLDTAQKAKLKSSIESAAIGKGRVDYIRGKFVRSNAGVIGDIPDTTVSNDTLDPAIYRARGRYGRSSGNPGNPNFIGEIIYSQPHYVDNHGTLSNYHPARDKAEYKNFLHSSVEGVGSPAVGAREPIVLFGSNDGKVYALNGENGEVIFQYVPLGAYDKLAETTQPGFKGDTLVAGQFEVKDVQYSDGSWHTLAVGSMGAGGKSVFAFDLNKENLNDPEKFIKWEQTSESELGQTLGNVMAKPRIVWLADKSTSKEDDGKWVVLVPNGYNNDANSASLIVFDAETGQVIAEIDTKAQAAKGSVNGLGPLTVQDYDFDGGVDFVYAGDLQGNVWKFDLTGWKENKIDLAYQASGSTRSSTLKAYAAANEAYRAALKAGDATAIAAALKDKEDAYAAIPAAEPFFVAMDKKGQRQPITSEISIADSADGEGAMLYFGTGSLFSTDDALKAQPQSFYAVNENYRYLTDNTIRAQLKLPLDRNDLFAKKVVELSSPNSDSDAERDKWMKNYGQLRGITDAAATNNDGNSAFTQDSYLSYNKSGKKVGSGDKLGWFIDFPEESYTAYSDSGERTENGVLERVLNQPTISDNELYFLSFSPRQGAQVKKQVSCDGTAVEVKGGESGITRFYMLDRMTGNYLDEAPFDLSGDGVTDETDMVTIDSSSATSTAPVKSAAGMQLTGGYATLAGVITTVKKKGKEYIDNTQFESSDSLCETERQIIFPSATDKDGNPLVLKGCYENRFRVWKQIQQEF